MPLHCISENRAEHRFYYRDLYSSINDMDLLRGQFSLFNEPICVLVRCYTMKLVACIFSVLWVNVILHSWTYAFGLNLGVDVWPLCCIFSSTFLKYGLKEAIRSVCKEKSWNKCRNKSLCRFHYSSSKYSKYSYIHTVNMPNLFG